MSRLGQGDPSVHPFAFDRVLTGEGPGGSGRIEAEKKVFEEAQREGEKLGFEKGLEQAEQVRRHLEGLIRELETSRSEWYAKLEEEILSIIFRIAEKVIHREIQADASVQRSIIAEGLKKLRQDEDVVIRVSPSGFTALQEALPALCEHNGLMGRVTLQEDASVTEGGCVLETGECEVDARIESCLKMIEEAFRQS
jgi:flagellar biosynthesis/type III secretory pathway protein FliH